MKAFKNIEHGNRFPYDGEGGMQTWAHIAARGIISNLEERSGFDDALHGAAKESRREIINTMAEIIRTALTISTDT